MLVVSEVSITFSQGAWIFGIVNPRLHHGPLPPLHLCSAEIYLYSRQGASLLIRGIINSLHGLFGRRVKKVETDQIVNMYSGFEFTAGKFKVAYKNHW